MRRCIASLVFFLIVAPIQASDARPTAEYRVSMSFSTMIVIGAVWPSFEYIIDGRHGLLLEGAYYLFGVSAGDYEAGVGYRRYFSEPFEGAFLGGVARAGKQSGKVSDGKYSYEIPFWVVGANAGRKWQWDNGLCFTGRLGYGYPITDAKWTPERPESEIAPFIEALMGLDAELSLGYSL